MSVVGKKFTFSINASVLADGKEIAKGSLEYQGLDYEQLLEMESKFFVRPLNELQELGREKLKQDGGSCR